MLLPLRGGGRHTDVHLRTGLRDSLVPHHVAAVLVGPVCACAHCLVCAALHGVHGTSGALGAARVLSGRHRSYNVGPVAAFTSPARAVP